MHTYTFEIKPGHKELAPTTVKVEAFNAVEARVEAVSLYAEMAAKFFFGTRGIALEIDDDRELDVVFALSGAADKGGAEDVIEFRAYHVMDV
jgi:hypothetical protein